MCMISVHCKDSFSPLCVSWGNNVGRLGYMEPWNLMFRLALKLRKDFVFADQIR